MNDELKEIVLKLSKASKHYGYVDGQIHMMGEMIAMFEDYIDDIDMSELEKVKSLKDKAMSELNEASIAFTDYLKGDA